MKSLQPLGSQKWKQFLMKLRNLSSWMSQTYNALCFSEEAFLTIAGFTFYTLGSEFKWILFTQGVFRRLKNIPTVYTLSQLNSNNVFKFNYFKLRIFHAFFLSSIEHNNTYLFLSMAMHSKMLSSIKIKCLKSLMMLLWLRVLPSSIDAKSLLHY